MFDKEIGSPLGRLLTFRDWSRISPVILIFIWAIIFIIFGSSFSFLKVLFWVGIGLFFVYFIVGFVWFKKNY